MEQLGKTLKTRGEEMNQTIAMINGETDLKIFIDTNKSLNQFLSKEVF